MLFNSFGYFLFLPAVVLIYFILPYRWRNAFLLAGSYYFYMSWEWKFGLLLLFVSIVNYVAGLKIEKGKTLHTRKLWLSVAVILSLGILAYFKYANFFLGQAIMLLKSAGLEVRPIYLKIILPVGISFFTFQSLSYTIDVFKGKTAAERNIIDFALFTAFFPTLVAGPISRATNLLVQVREKHHFSSDNLIQGAKLILWGLFKKAVIADRLAPFVDQVYSSPSVFGGSTLFLATLFFTFQLYCDFSGYSDIAIGSAHILGIRLVQNFNLPYLASTIREFWQRWHISMTTWFRDYLFLPVAYALAGRIKSERVLFINTELFVYAIASIITWLLTGLWHGASWTFVIWGLMHGFFLIIYQWQRKPGNRMLKRIGIKKRNSLFLLVKTLFTFFLVMIAWTFFRADSINEAVYISANMFTGWYRIPYLGPSAFETIFGLSLIIMLTGIMIMQHRGMVSIYMRGSSLPRSLRWTGYALLIIMIAMFGVSSEQFIYFQF